MSEETKAKLRALRALGKASGAPRATAHAATNAAILADLRAFGSPAFMFTKRQLDKDKAVASALKNT